MKLCVLIPALNEEKKIKETIEKVQQETKKYSTTVLVVNDGSTDATSKIAKNSGAVVIDHTINLGVGAAFQSGLDYALKNNIDILVNIDADGQFSPSDIDKLIDEVIHNNADLVISNRFANGKPENMTNLKFYGNKMMNKLISFLTRKEFNDVSSGFRAYNKEAMLQLNLLGDFTYTHEVILNLSIKRMNIKEVPVNVKYFKDRKSRVAGNIIKYAFKTSAIIFKTFRDYKPLRFFGGIGLFIFLIGLIIDAFMLSYFMFTGGFSPFISIILTGVYLNTLGIGIAILGIIADMLDRHRKNQEKILYYQKIDLYEKEK